MKDGAATQPARIVKPFEGIEVHLEPDPRSSFIEIKAWTCLDEGWLEQIACGPNSREHESLVVIKAKPSQIHAALLMAGFNPGAPGKWTYDNNKLGTVSPTGDKVDVLVRYGDPAGGGKIIEQPIRNWIRDGSMRTDETKRETFPHLPWVFGGSIIAPNPKPMGPGEHYVADYSGSIIGLVTFGDEVLGFSKVLADEETVQAPEWEVNPKTIPPVETEVTVILRRFKD